MAATVLGLMVSAAPGLGKTIVCGVRAQIAALGGGGSGCGASTTAARPVRGDALHEAAGATSGRKRSAPGATRAGGPERTRAGRTRAGAAGQGASRRRLAVRGRAAARVASRSRLRTTAPSSRLARERSRREERRARERAARAELIRAGHIPPPGKMTAREVEIFLDAYEREHNKIFSAQDRLLIGGRLRQGEIVAVKPSDMKEPEWARRAEQALNVLSLIPVGRGAKVAKSLARRAATVGVRNVAALRAEAQEAAARAVAQVGPGKGSSYGSRVHGALARQIAGSPNLKSEISYLKGREVPYGTKGSIRLDVVAIKKGRAAAIYDLKTGSARLTSRGIGQIQKNVPPHMRNLPIEELRP